MAEEATYREIGKVILLCIFWYTASSANNIVGKIILSDFPYPMTLSMVQLVSISLYLFPILKLWKVPKSEDISMKYWMKMIFPLAFGKFLGSVLGHISIWKVPVSYAHTVKATMPLFTVLLSWLIMGEKQTLKVYLSLIPIIGGVAIATITELSFNVIGLVTALLATMFFALQNIFSKKCLKETGIHHLRLLVILARIAALCFAPLWAFNDLKPIITDGSLIHSTHFPRLLALLLIDGFCNFAQNMIAFTLIALITPLSYAVANATKRICIVSMSLIMLKNPVTPVNVFGMLTAILGVLLYNKTKFDQNRARRREQILPYVKTEIDLTKHTYDPLERLKHSQSQASLLLRDESRITEKYSKDYIMFGNGSVPNGVSGSFSGLNNWNTGPNLQADHQSRISSPFNV